MTVPVEQEATTLPGSLRQVRVTAGVGEGWDVVGGGAELDCWCPLPPFPLSGDALLDGDAGCDVGLSLGSWLWVLSTGW